MNIRELDNCYTYIAPSILAANFANLETDILKVENSKADIIHIDVMDGLFVPNISMGQPIVKSLRKVTELIFDTHLMITHPEKYIKSFVDAGADHITIHFESETNIENTLKSINDEGISVGISLKPKTSPEVLEKFMDIVDLILVMTVEPGFGGQSFMENQLSKISTIQKMIKTSKRNIHIQVDGGIDVQTAQLVKKAGANILVAGTSVFKSKDIKQTIIDLKS